MAGCTHDENAIEIVSPKEAYQDGGDTRLHGEQGGTMTVREYGLTVGDFALTAATLALALAVSVTRSDALIVATAVAWTASCARLWRVWRRIA